MGWASGGAIFDPIAEALINEEASEDLKRLVLGKLIGVLQDGDWDTESESLGEFGDDLVVRSLFYQHNVGNRFGNRFLDWPEGELGYDPDHRVWTLTCKRCGPIEFAPFTAEGHDGLVHAWPEHVGRRHDETTPKVADWMLINH